VNLRDPKERTALAGEYVLGTFDENERRGFERQLQDDATLRAEVSRWHDRVLALASRLEPVPPGPSLWDELEREILDTRARRERAERSLWQRLDVWQLIAGVAVAAVMLFGALLLLTWSAQRDARLVALLQDGSGEASWVVEGRPRSGLSLRPVIPAVGMSVHRASGGSAEFWTQMPGAREPVLLGTLGVDESTEIAASRLPGLVEGQMFGITLKRPSASPEDATPATSVVFTGKVVALPN
jgi:anti-sigma-K factor RskA